MRVNVYTKELISGGDLPLAEITSATHVSVKTGKEMKNYGLRIFLESPPELHYVPPRDDDRSAVTFWCGDEVTKVFDFWRAIMTALEVDNMHKWRDKVSAAAARAEAAEDHRRGPQHPETQDKI